MSETTELTIRREEGRDAESVVHLNELAFGRPDEAEIVRALHAAGAVTLSLVAEKRGRVVGHILFSPVTVATPAGPFAAIGLAPMAVLPREQKKGIGSRLVREGIDELRRSGHEAVIVLGHPDFYPRFGFVRASRFGLRWEHPCPDEAFMAIELRPDAFAGRAGIVRYRPEFGSG